MVNGSFIAFADDFGVAVGAAGAFFIAGADDCAGADFVGVCAVATDVVSMAAAAKQTTDTVE